MSLTVCDHRTRAKQPLGAELQLSTRQQCNLSCRFHSLGSSLNQLFPRRSQTIPQTDLAVDQLKLQIPQGNHAAMQCRHAGGLHPLDRGDPHHPPGRTLFRFGVRSDCGRNCRRGCDLRCGGFCLTRSLFCLCIRPEEAYPVLAMLQTVCFKVLHAGAIGTGQPPACSRLGRSSPPGCSAQSL